MQLETPWLKALNQCTQIIMDVFCDTFPQSFLKCLLLLLLEVWLQPLGLFFYALEVL